MFEVVHGEFNSDEIAGGYAFTTGELLIIVGRDGGWMHAEDPGHAAARLAEVDQYFARSRHRHRKLEFAELTVWHQAAIRTIELGLPRVESFAILGSTVMATPLDLAKANYVLILLRRYMRDSEVSTAFRVLASDDHLLRAPLDEVCPHDCPVCGLPTLGGPRYARALCDECNGKTICVHGRRVKGYNTSLGGGFEAAHVNDESVCADTTANGRCWVEGLACDMGEAKFGGVYVQALPV